MLLNFFSIKSRPAFKAAASNNHTQNTKWYIEYFWYYGKVSAYKYKEYETKEAAWDIVDLTIINPINEVYDSVIQLLNGTIKTTTMSDKQNNAHIDGHWETKDKSVPVSAELIVEQNFEGLHDFIKDKSILDFYKRLIQTCMEEYAAQLHPEPTSIFHKLVDGKLQPVADEAELKQLLSEVYQLINGWKEDESWSEWDESIRVRVLAYLEKLQVLAQLQPIPEAIKQEIKEVQEGAKVDTSKLHIRFSEQLHPVAEQKTKKVKCHCPCHKNPNIKHVVACCDNGYIEVPDFYPEKKELHPVAEINESFVSKEEHEHAINIIGQLQEQLKEANEHINDLNKGYEADKSM